MTNDAGFLERDKFPIWAGNHAINEVWIDGKRTILDATNNRHRYPYYPNGDTDVWLINFMREEYFYNPPTLPEDNAYITASDISIKKDGSAVFFGFYMVYG
jgi:hypothetical protein